jgi:CRISPR-associated endonuclease/helicase Cas3
MTSLDRHPGRPEIGPWLRGWVSEELQTTIIWRTHLPMRVDAEGRTILPEKAQIEDFFEAAPPHQSEKLETETYRVAGWLQDRGNALLKREQRPPGNHAEDTEPETWMADDIEIEKSSRGSVLPAGKLQSGDIVALMLSSSGAYAGCYTLADLAEERKGKAKEGFHGELIGKTLLVDVRLGGLRKGLLGPDCDDLCSTADGSSDWSRKAQFRVRASQDDEEPHDAEEWRFEDEFILRRDGEGHPLVRIIVEHFRDAAEREDARSISGRAQELAEHQSWAADKARRIAERIGLLGDATKALTVAASLHDEGKKALRWQRAFKAARDAKKYGLSGPLAKTRGPISQAVLGGYRHEFGSLPYVEDNAEFKALPDEWRELVLQLIAAHHGQARPVIETRGREDGPPSLLEERALAVALRFARLQKRWGPWGLAWWEALMRAADQQASRRLEEDS